MTTDRPATLYVTDAELIRRLGVPEKAARVAIRELERRPGFPQRDALFDNRRYWPAVRAFLDRRAGVTMDGGPAIADGPEEAFDAPRNRRGARPGVAAAH